MSGSYLLDTNVFINAIKRQLLLPSAHYAYSVITELELLAFPGLLAEEEHAIKAILGQLTRVELDYQVKTETIKVRRSTQMKLPDSIISASAMVAASTLVTDDVKLAEKHAGNVISLDTLLSR
ncbi:type II toxin-antitoxin system VapC family toxin [Vreelandella maris]|uniref:Type II toxin-antitoxin system VapC family toxin n=1 Tax=Vreelandella maris TaxID=2729617 RepID=A0A7Y6RB62_9GAMM|nr:type II toxin-antitoxin system VapC family toxin [Halomonas maris]NVF13735.1 type II toxin-antitoxin system VapC family toxin [Halomonas maris]|tara:strand:+ start:152 stop:520 length:369 start_codon:yes stop_codon:yes gene_type:complete